MAFSEYVYFIKSGDLVKIGKTVNIKARFKSYLLHNPGVELLYLTNTLNENDVHKKFKLLRVNGEWFSLTNEIYKYIDDCKKENMSICIDDQINNINSNVFDIERNSVDVLSPFEIDKIVKKISKPNLKTLFYISLFTAMRYVEIKRLYMNPMWINNNIIKIPGDKLLGDNRRSVERNIPIHPLLVRELTRFYKNSPPPHHKVWGEDLQRWSVQSHIDKHVVPKSIRSTMISWMISADIPFYKIGHIVGISKLEELDYYRSQIKFDSDEKIEIRKRLSSWV